MNRTYNGELRKSDVGKTVLLKGWASKVRNLGGLIFIDLRDRYGITQVVVRPDNEFYELATTVRNEFVLEVEGEVVVRESINKNIPTGEIEIDTNKLTIINKSLTPAIDIKDDLNALEETRLKYRYLDLRRTPMQNYIITKSKTTKIVRNYLEDQEFLDLETPILCQSTPEGARDFLVPSRVHKNHFYALPQSPQIYKQLYMISGFEKYYQIAKCFRDEDLRSDRQLEFSQIDIEMSFKEQEDVFTLIEGLLKNVFKEIKGMDLKLPFDRLTYEEALNNYGSDKPDRRFDLLLRDVTDLFEKLDFDLFKTAKEKKSIIKSIVLKDMASGYSRKEIEKLEKIAKNFRASSFLWFKVENELPTGGMAKFVSNDFSKIKEEMALENNDLVIVVVDKAQTANEALGQVRLEVGRTMKLIDEFKYDFCWVIDWPLFEYSEEDNRFYALHHPFTAPKKEHAEFLVTDPAKCLSNSYDIVVNGYELGGGSVRIYDQEMQANMFNTLGFSEEEAINQFGFFIEALKYGTPPHLGIALGLDRLIMLLTNTNNIKDVTAFPKTNSAQCLLTSAPGMVSDLQLEELALNLVKTDE